MNQKLKIQPTEESFPPKPMTATAVVRLVESAIVHLRAGGKVNLGGQIFSSLDGVTLRDGTENVELEDELRLLISRKRAQALQLPNEHPVLVSLQPRDTLATLQKISLSHPAEATTRPVVDFADGESILKLCILAGHAPVALAHSAKSDADVYLDPSVLNAYYQARVDTLTLRSKARMPVRGDIKTEMLVFENAAGLKEVVLKIGNPSTDKPALVRLHSACVTGDIFGSMRCDCGDQLSTAIEKMDELGGGYLLYLAQEGRGIGLSNKIRAYALQDQGLDTVDANGALGFEDDLRNYGTAAKMLNLLDINDVRLLTNNPKKVDALKKHDVQVTERIAHEIPPNIHNKSYLATKAAKSGHMLSYKS